MREPVSDDDADRPGPWWTADAADFAGAEPPLEGLEPPSDDSVAARHDGTQDGEDATLDAPAAAARTPRTDDAPDASAGGSEGATVGTAAVELARLLGALGDWASANGVTDNLRKIGDEAAAAVSQAWSEQVQAASEESPVEHRDASGAFVPCEVCPLCQGMVLARGVAPPLMQAAAKALSVIDEALRNASND